MFFNRYRDALEYSVGQSQDTRRAHKAVKATAWQFCRKSGEYFLAQGYTVILVTNGF